LEEDMVVYQQDGILKHATYTSVNEVTEDNKLEAGKNVFTLACSRCHTGQGVNSVVDVFERMYNNGQPLDVEMMTAYIPNMHFGRNYMPPFPGNEAEAEALAIYIRHLQDSGESIEGVQTEGVMINSDYTVKAVINKQNKTNDNEDDK
jgi:mono/diheme cytochrome c family protein